MAVDAGSGLGSAGLRVLSSKTRPLRALMDVRPQTLVCTEARSASLPTLRAREIHLLVTDRWLPTQHLLCIASKPVQPLRD
ncbi:hypothetical protein Hanom_Chr09g00821921 [Helianthus anomalus]